MSAPIQLAYSSSLVTDSKDLTVLLHAVDCWPNVCCVDHTAAHARDSLSSLSQGGLYHGAYAVEAARRYEQIWLPLLAAKMSKKALKW